MRTRVPLEALAGGAAAFLFFFSSVAAQAASYNCKPDRKLDIPMEFTAFAESAGRLHLSAFGGADKSGWVAPYSWRVFDAAGNQLDWFPRTDLGFASPNMLRETSVEGLVPGKSYTVELVSYDLCARLGSSRQSLKLPAATVEGSLPVVSTPVIVRVGFQTAVSSVIQFSATDLTGVKRVSVYIDGDLITERTYFDGTSFRWWTDPYPSDGVQSSLEGPNFYVNYPDAYRNRYLTVDVVVEDYFGNVTTSTAQLPL